MFSLKNQILLKTFFSLGLDLQSFHLLAQDCEVTATYLSLADLISLPIVLPKTSTSAFLLSPAKSTNYGTGRTTSFDKQGFARFFRLNQA